MPSTATCSSLALALAVGFACGYAPRAEARQSVAVVHPAEAVNAVQALKAADFLASLGVVTHLNYTDGTYANFQAVISDLDYLGIHNLRDATPNPDGGIPYLNYSTALQALADAGNRFDFITWPAQPLSTSLNEIAAVETLHPGAVIAVEGPNETNNNPVVYHGEHGTRGALAYQRDLYQAVHSSGMLRHVAVYYYTGLDVATNLTGLADFANCHPYSYQGEQPGSRIASEFGKRFPIASSYPKVITEAGYFDVPSKPNGVDDATQAKDTLNLYMDAFSQGVALTYVYQLVSAYPDQGSDTQAGMFRIDHTPKPVAIAIHNLTTILADPNPQGFAPALLDYSVAAMPADGQSLLLEKSTGVFDIVLWSEAPNWNDHDHRAIAIAPAPVTVAMTGTDGDFTVYDPMAGIQPIKTEHHAKSIVVSVSDHPLIIEVRLGGEHVMTADTASATGATTN